MIAGVKTRRAAAVGAASLATAAAAYVGALNGPGTAAALAGLAALSLAFERRFRAPERRAPAAPAIASEGATPAAGPPGALAAGAGRGLLERLPVGLVLLDERGRAIFENPAARDVLERSVLGQNGAAAFRAPRLVEAVGQAARERRESEIDVTLLRASERVVHAFVRPLEAEGPRPRPDVLVLLEDRTAVARAEAMRRDFVANASHELKTPLAAISGLIETLQGHAKDDPEATRRFLGMMGAQTGRMRRLIEDLLSLNRIEVNEHVQPRQPVDLAATAREVAAALAPLAEAQGGRIEVDLPPEELVARGDAGEIAQIFRNLIDNAVKYAGEAGPVRVTQASNGRRGHAMIGITVADSGPGIAREHIPRLTERFYRVSPARSRERGGTGLGLAIVKHILNRHRGDLSIASAPGEGSRFTVWLPAFEASGRAAAPGEATRHGNVAES